jgi:hypothetical protein
VVLVTTLQERQSERGGVGPRNRTRWIVVLGAIAAVIVVIVLVAIFAGGGGAGGGY